MEKWQNGCTCSVDKARSFHFVANDHYDVAYAQTSDAVSTLSPLCRNASKLFILGLVSQGD